MTFQTGEPISVQDYSKQNLFEQLIRSQWRPSVALRKGWPQQESQGLVQGGHLAELVFSKWHCVRMALREKTFDSWRELRNELGLQTDDCLPCAGRVCVWTKHRRKVANQAMLLGSDSFPSKNKQRRSN